MDRAIFITSLLVVIGEVKTASANPTPAQPGRSGAVLFGGGKFCHHVRKNIHTFGE
jgi:hypothetical protein